jgi:hypothetical protein
VTAGAAEKRGAIQRHNFTHAYISVPAVSLGNVREGQSPENAYNLPCACGACDGYVEVGRAALFVGKMDLSRSCANPSYREIGAIRGAKDKIGVGRRLGLRRHPLFLPLDPDLKNRRNIR